MLLKIPYQLVRLYWNVVKPRALGVRVIIESQDRLLFVHHTYLPKYYFPGGGLKKKESFEDAARREVLEETGLTISLTHFQGVYQFFAEGKQDTVVVFRARVMGKNKIVKDHSEIKIAKWYKKTSPPDLANTTTYIYEDYKAGLNGVVRLVE